MPGTKETEEDAYGKEPKRYGIAGRKGPYG